MKFIRQYVTTEQTRDIYEIYTSPNDRPTRSRKTGKYTLKERIGK